MELFNKLFARMLVFVYHCFDRVVINGYLSMLSRPENVVYFFRQVVGVPSVTQEVLKQRTADYQAWVEAYARNQRIPIEWAEKGVRKEDRVAPFLKRMERQNRYGVYFIYKSMEQGTTFRCLTPKFPPKDPNYTLLRKTRSRFTHYYFYLRDPHLGPMILRVASFLPFQTTYFITFQVAKGFSIAAAAHNPFFFLPSSLGGVVIIFNYPLLQGVPFIAWGHSSLTLVTIAR